MVIALLALSAHAASPLLLGDEGALSAQPGLLVQPKATTTLKEEPSLDLSLQRVRPLVKGTLHGPGVRYFVQAELAGQPALLDALIDVRATSWLHVRTGRFLVPYSRAQLTPVPKLQFQGFAASTNTQRHGRDVGAQLQATPLNGRLDARIGVFQGGTIDPTDPRPVSFARVSLDVLGEVPLDETTAANDPDGSPGLAVGVGGSAGTELRQRDGLDLDSQAVSGELAARFGPARLQSEVYARSWSDGLSDVGGYAQASVAPIPQLELATRLDLLHTEYNQTTVDGLVSWYAQGNHLRASLLYTMQQVEGMDSTHTVSLLQQLWF